MLPLSTTVLTGSRRPHTLHTSPLQTPSGPSTTTMVPPAPKNVTNALPKLPGYDFSALRETLTHGRGMRVVAVGSGPFAESALLRRHPGWQSLLDKTLRFFGYFVETVCESRLETSRVRKVTLRWYLADHTLDVVETPPLPNSGMRGGALMGRHAPPDGLSPESLRIGESVELRGLTIMLVDCDAFTRTVYRVAELPQPSEQMEYPPDAWESSVLQPKRVIDGHHRWMRHVCEAQAAAAAGRAANLIMTPATRERARTFYSLPERDTLVFLATWQTRHFALTYYLLDGTMSVNEIHSTNSGRDPCSVFLKRAKIPKFPQAAKSNPIVAPPPSAGSVDGEGEKYITAGDLRCGSTVTLYSRAMFLYCCNEGTRQYYADTLGIAQVDVPKPTTEGEEANEPAPWVVPPPTGYGSEEDSLVSCYHLVLRPPRKNESALDVGKLLRFSAELDHPLPEDTGRRFVVCYYLSDGTVSAYETVVRNSGHVGGKVFARRRVQGLTREAFSTGECVTLGGYVLRLKAMDDATRMLLTTGNSSTRDMAPQRAAADLRDRVHNVLTQRFGRAAEAYRHYSTDKRGLSLPHVREMLKEMDMEATPATVEALMRLIDRDGDGVVSFLEFVEGLYHSVVFPQATTTAEDKRETLQGGSYDDMQRQRDARALEDRVLRSLITRLEARRAFLVDTFRVVSDHSIDGLIGVAAFSAVVQDRLDMRLSDAEMNALLRRVFGVSNDVDEDVSARRLTLQQFRKALDF